MFHYPANKVSLLTTCFDNLDTQTDLVEDVVRDLAHSAGTELGKIVLSY